MYACLGNDMFLSYVESGITTSADPTTGTIRDDEDSNSGVIIGVVVSLVVVMVIAGAVVAAIILLWYRNKKRRYDTKANGQRPTSLNCRPLLRDNSANTNPADTNAAGSTVTATPFNLAGAFQAQTNGVNQDNYHYPDPYAQGNDNRSDNASVHDDDLGGEENSDDTADV